MNPFGVLRLAVWTALSTLCGILLPLVARAQVPTVEHIENFQSYGTQANPSGWIDSAVGEPRPTALGVYKSWPDPIQGNKGTEIVYGTRQASGQPEGNNPRIGAFSTYTKKSFDGHGRFEYRGRFIRTSNDARVGLTFFSSYPNQDRYYLVGLWSQPSSPGLTMQLFAFGGGAPAETTNSGFTPEPNKWYRFLFQVDVVGDVSNIRARFWPDGTLEPSTFSINAVDRAADRPTSGHIGLWSAVRGESYVDDLFAKSPVDFTAPTIAFYESNQILPDGAAFNRDVIPEIRVTDDLDANPLLTATLDGEPYTSLTPVTAEGRHTIVARATDSAGNQNSAVVSFLIDKTLPVIRVLESGEPFPPPGLHFNRDVTPVIVIDDLTATIVTATLNGQTFTSGTSITAEGTYTLAVSARDDVGWESAISPIAFVVDKTVPSIGIDPPADGSVVTNPRLTFAGTSDDAVSITVNGVPATIDSAAKRFRTADALMLEGSNVFTFVATDRAGNASTQARTIVLDTRAPELSVASPPRGACLNTTAIELRGTAIDPRLDTVNVNGTAAAVDKATGAWSIVIPAGEDGRKSLAIVAADAAGHNSTASHDVIVDRTNPAIEITEGGAPLGEGRFFNRNVSLFARVADADSNATLTLSLDGSPYVSGASISAQGSHTLAATASDCAGNSSQKSVTFTIDRTAPAIRDLAPANDALLGEKPSNITGSTETDVTAISLAGIASVTPDPAGRFTFSGVPFEEGLNRYTLRAIDRAGNESELQYTVRVQSAAPSVEILESGSPLQTASLFNRQVTPIVRASDGANVTATLNGAPYHSGTPLTSDGTYTLVATATNALGKTGRAETSFAIDQTAPIVDITAPAAGIVLADRIEVRGTAGDSVAVTVNGAAATLASGAFSIASLPLEIGENVIVAVGRDRAGNIGRDQVTITRDADVAGIILTHPPDRGLTNRPATDVIGRVLTPAPGQSVTINGVAVTMDASGAFTLPNLPLQEGENLITATLTAGGRSNAATVRITADFTAPVVRLLESGRPLSDAQRFAQQAVIAADAGNDLATLVIDGSSVASPFTVTTAGGHTAIATARDAAGNESRIERTFYVGASGAACAISGLDPADGSIVTSGSVTLVGRSGGAAGVKVNGVAAPHFSNGSFCATVELPSEGSNPVTIVCTAASSAAIGDPVTIHLIRVTGTPSIAINAPAPDAYFATPAITVSGTTSANAVSVDVNGAPATLANGAWSAQVILSSGLNNIVARAKNAAGRSATASRRALYIKDAPSIAITSPLDGYITGANTVSVSGSYIHLDPSTISTSPLPAVSLGEGSGVRGDTNGAFNFTGIPLTPGPNTITVTGADKTGRTASATLTVHYSPGAPAISIAQPLDQSFFGASAGNDVTVTGAATGAPGSIVEVNGVPATFDGSSYSAAISFSTLGGGLTPIVARLTQLDGTSATATVQVTKLPNAPSVIEAFPAPNANAVDPGSVILVLFSAPMNRASLASGGFTLETSSGVPVSGLLYLDRDVASFAPSVPLVSGETYRIKISTAATDLGGNALSPAYDSTFSVAASAPGTAPAVTPITAALCANSIDIVGTAPAGARLRIESGGQPPLSATADASGNFKVPFALTGQSGFRVVRIRIVGADGSLSPAAELKFKVDCAGPQVTSATFDRSANKLTIVFSRAIDAASAVVGQSIVIQRDGLSISGTSTATSATSFEVTPADDLRAATFTLTVNSGIRDTTGRTLAPTFVQLFSVGGGEPGAADGSGFISGEIFDASTGRPLAAAVVRATGKLPVTATTDSRGRYFARVPEGAHTIEAAADGYTTVWRQIVVPAGAGVVPVDIRLTRRGTSATDGGDTAVTRRVELRVATGTVTAVGSQGLAGLLPLGWSPLASAEVRGNSLAGGQLVFTLPETSRALTGVQYDEERDEWIVIAPVVVNGTLSINAAGSYAIVYPDEAPRAVPPAAVAGAPLRGVTDPCATTPCPLINDAFTLDPPIVFPTDRSVATLKVQGGASPFPSGTAVQAYIDEELTLADGSTLLDPPFATDLLLYRDLSGQLGIADFHIAPSAKAAEVILQVGYDRMKILPYPGRLDRGTLIGPEGGRVPGDTRTTIDIPAGALAEPVHASVASFDTSSFNVAGFKILSGFTLTLQRTATTPTDLDGDGQPDALPPVEILRAAQATFTATATGQVILAQVRPDHIRLANLTAKVDELRYTTRPIDRAVLPLDGITREGQYLILEALQPIAYATGTVRLRDTLITAPPLGVKDVTRPSLIFNIPVPVPNFTLQPRHASIGDASPYAHPTAVTADAVINVGELPLIAQPPVVTSTVPANGTTSVSLTTNIQVNFSQPVEVATEAISVVDSVSGIEAAVTRATTSPTSTSIIWTTSGALRPNGRYIVTLPGTTRGANGALLGRSHVFGFATVTQDPNATINRSRISITIPVNGVSTIRGGADALPRNQQWTLAAVRHGVGFIQQYGAQANTADGSFSFPVGNGPSSDRVSTRDRIDLHILNSVGNLAAVVPLTPFVTAEGNGFIAEPGSEARFTSSEASTLGATITVPADAFDQPTLVTLSAAPRENFLTVPKLDTELKFATAIRVDFEGRARTRLQLELPLPPGYTPNPEPYFLGYLGESVRGPRIMAVDTLAVKDGKFTTAAPSTLTAKSVQAFGVAPAADVPVPVKETLMGVLASGQFGVLQVNAVAVGGALTWAALGNVNQAVELYWSTLEAMYASVDYVASRGKHIVIPIVEGKPFVITGVDAATGLQSFTKAYDPKFNSDPNTAVPIENPSPDEVGPYPVFASPSRLERVDITGDETKIPLFKLSFDDEHAMIEPNLGENDDDPFVEGTSVVALNASRGELVSGTAAKTSFSLDPLEARRGDRIVILAAAKDVDPQSTVSVVFSEPLELGDDDDADAYDAFLKSHMAFRYFPPIEPGGASADCKPSDEVQLATTAIDLTHHIRYRVDSGGRRITVELPATLVRGAKYQWTLKQSLSDRAGNPLGQGVVLADDGTATEQQLGKDLVLEFFVRRPRGLLSCFEVTPSALHDSAAIRDVAKNGNLAFVSALDGGLIAYDFSDPASLSGSDAAAPKPFAFVPARWRDPNDPTKFITTGLDEHWAVATDHHGRVYSTGFTPAFGVLRSYRVEDFVEASKENPREELCAGSPNAPPNSLCRFIGSAVIGWRPGYAASLGLSTDTINTDRPTAYPRKMQILVQDAKEEVFGSLEEFQAKYSPENEIEYANGFFVFDASFLYPRPEDDRFYLTQRVTVVNATTGMRWSADIGAGGSAVVEGITARPGDELRVTRNERTYAVVAQFGYGIGVYDINAIESNDLTLRCGDPVFQQKYADTCRLALTQALLEEQVLLTNAQRDASCGPELPANSIETLTFSPESVIRPGESASKLAVYGADTHRGLLDLTFSPTDGSPECPDRDRGLVFVNKQFDYAHPRLEEIRDKGRTGRFNSVSHYAWRLEAADNHSGARGSIANQPVTRDYVLVAGYEYGLLVVETGGSPAPKEYPSYKPLRDDHLVDVIWIPAGAVSVRAIPQTNLAIVVDGRGRLMLVDLSRIDERWNENGDLRPFDELFPTARKAMNGASGELGELGSDDPRIVWKSEPGTVPGTLAPLFDPDSGIALTGEVLAKTMKVLSLFDPNIRMKVNLGRREGLSEVGGVIPLGIAPPKKIAEEIAALEACAEGDAAALTCRENASMAAFRLEMNLPGSITESLDRSGGKLTMAIESERVAGAVTEQTPAGFPRAHLRKSTRDGGDEEASRAVDLVFERLIPRGTDDAQNEEIENRYRHQAGFNKFVSPWIVAIADPRASQHYLWPSGTSADRKKKLGCPSCDRPKHLEKKDEKKNVYELYTNGRAIAVRPELVLANETIFHATPYEHLAKRLEARFPTFMADTVRPNNVLVAGFNPPVAGGMIQETVYLHSGEMETGRVDLVPGGRAGFDVAIDRGYRSRTLGGTVFGLGWDSSLLRRLRALPDGNIEYRDGAEVWLFEALDDARGLPTSEAERAAGITASYKSPKGLFLKLVRTARGWTMFDQMWRIMAFDEHGRLIVEADEFNDATEIAAGRENPEKGNIIRYHYDESGRLAEIIDPVKRKTKLTYWSEDERDQQGAYVGLLKEVKDWRQRSVRYEYDDAGRLVKVLLPEAAAADGVPSEFEFTGDARPKVVYAYDESLQPPPDPAEPSQEFTDYLELAPNLLSIKEPHEAAKSDGKERVRFVYGEPGTPLTRDKVVSEVWPCANASMTSCGELASTFTYLDQDDLGVVTDAEVDDILDQARLYALTDVSQFDSRAHVQTMTEKSVPVINTSSRSEVRADEQPAERDLVTQFAYNEHGQHTHIVLPNGLTIDNTYDKAKLGAAGTILKSTIESKDETITTTFDYETAPNAQNNVFKISKNGVSRPASAPSRKREITQRVDSDFKSSTKFNGFGQPVSLREGPASEGDAEDSNGENASEAGQPWRETTIGYHDAVKPDLIMRGAAKVVTRGTDDEKIESEIEFEELEHGSSRTTVRDTARDTVTITTRDSLDRVIETKVTDGGSETLYEERVGYDAAGRLAFRSTKQKQVNEVVERSTYDPLDRQLETTMTGAKVMGTDATIASITDYDLTARRITTTDPHETGNAASAPRTTISLDRLGRRESAERSASGVGATEKMRFAYDITGSLAYETDTRLVATIREFDSFGREKSWLRTDGVRSETTYTAWDEPLITMVKASNGTIIAEQKNLYTSLGRVRATNERVDATRARSNRIGWEADGGKKSSQRLGFIPDIDAVLNGLSRATETIADSAGRVTTTRSGESEGISGPIDQPFVEAVADLFVGDLPSRTIVREPIAGAEYQSIVEYDGLGRAEIVTEAGAYETETHYDETGNLLQLKEPGHTSFEEMTYDARGLLLRRTLYDGKTIEQKYDARAVLRERIDESGETTKYEIDPLGRVTIVRYPDATTEETRYEDVTGRVKAKKDRAGQWLSYLYDAGGRVKEIRSGEDPASGTILVTFAYDEGGRLKRVANKNAAIEYEEYDLLGRPQVTRTIRYANGTGLTEKTIADEHTQGHKWSIFDGERERWRMPVRGATLPATETPTPWRTWIDETRDAAGNLIAQRSVATRDGPAAGSLISEATARGIGRLMLRKRGPVSSSYGFADGTTPGSVEFPPEGASAPATGLIRWMETSVGGTAIAGSASSRDDAKRISAARKIGFSDRSSAWTYDVKGRLATSRLDLRRESSSAPVNDTFTDPDFRSARAVSSRFSPAQHEILGLASLEIEPPAWTATRETASRIGTRTLFAGDTPKQTRTYQFQGGRRTSDGLWTFEFDEFGRVVRQESVTARRRIDYLYDPIDRVIARTAYQLTDAAIWIAENRSHVLAEDGLAADVTFVWDSIVDRLVAIYPNGSSDPIRQYVHGDQAYDDVVDALVAPPTGGAPALYYPVIDEAATGSLQATLRDDGSLVERVLYGDAYGDAPRYLQGPVVEKIAFSARKAGENSAEVEVRIDLTEAIDASTLEPGVRLTSVKSDGSIAAVAATLPSLDDERTIIWTLAAADWSALSNAPDATSLQVVVTDKLRASAWGTAQVMRAPRFATLLFGGVSSTAAEPVIKRESLTNIKAFIDSLPTNGKTKRYEPALYEIADLYLAADVQSKAKLLFDIHAYPFVEPASGLVYARRRWLDTSTGTFLTPDPSGYIDSSNLYAGFGGDPVNNRDPRGECVDPRQCAANLFAFGSKLVDTAKAAVRRIDRLLDPGLEQREDERRNAAKILAHRMRQQGYIVTPTTQVWTDNILSLDASGRLTRIGGIDDATSDVVLTVAGLKAASPLIAQAYRTGGTRTAGLIVADELAGQYIGINPSAPVSVARAFTRRQVHDIGVRGGRTQAQADELMRLDWNNPFGNRGEFGQGFDDIFIGPDGTYYVIGEFKGGTARLAPGQMERQWVEDNIQRLINAGDPMGVTLRDALASGNLGGITYSTAIKNGVVQPTRVVKVHHYAQ